ncbi:TonB-dependent receptor plug domain-containing protein [Parashewanella tropica]|uniref:TonB-dependent receptor plug domain-containing protein n=1 Tax=Parashewanella tropica TaxID=2547970 RepID=UPI00105A614C|nr:TonB-dependent receptor [Parashewanella tropica]
MIKLKKLVVATSILSVSAPIFAADNENEAVERIEVTGSHIKRTDMEGPTPVTTLTAQDLADSGATDLIGALAKLPIAGTGTFSTQGNSSDDTSNGGSSVSLRGLGADSTLILVNGRRVSVSPFAKGIDTAYVDLNNIPIAAIKRVDIQKDGASAIYGSDAIAGVINVILKDDLDGAQISAKYGSTPKGGEEQNLSLVWGNQAENSKHTFVLDYFNREEVLYGDRSFSKTANQKARTGDKHATDFRSSSGFPGTIALRSDPSNRIPDTFGKDKCPEDQIVGNLCRYDYAPHMSMIPKTERFSFNYMGKYEINDSVRGFAELNGQNSRTVVKGAGSPSFNELTMAGDNPNHPFADQPNHEFHGKDLTMRRRMVDIGNRLKRVDSNYYRAIVGLEGEINDWSWEVAYNFIKSQSVERGVDGFPNKRRVQEAIDNGSFDPFEPSKNSQETLDFIETTTNRVGKSTMKSVDATISGPLMEMEHGDLMLAVGAEYRKESISDNPDDQYIRGEIFGTEATQAQGSRDNTAIYAEVAIPVLDTLEVQLAVRHEDYSDFGTTTDPKVSFLWNPMDNLSVRGSYGTAFRAPSLHQLGLGRTDESPTLIDTLRCDAIGAQPSGIDPCKGFEYTAVFQGNPDLKPEESKSYNLGLIYNLTDQIDFSIDYYNYQIENIIDSDTQHVLSTEGLDPKVVKRTPTSIPNDPGEIVSINDSFRNIGDLDTSGIDFNANYLFETGAGDFKVSYTLNYILEFEERRKGQVRKEVGDFDLPQFRARINTDWSYNDLKANLAINHIGSFKQHSSVRKQKDGTTLKDVDAMITIDTAVSYFGIENTVLTLGATNLFNEKPPFVYNEFMGFSTDTHSGQGRFWYVNASYKF